VGARRTTCLTVAVAALLVTLSAQHQTAETWRSLFDRHRWFELRDVIAGRPAPHLYRGAIAAAFNRIDEAERNLRAAVREATTTSAANEAREALATLYMRLGRSASLLTVIDQAVAADTTREELRAAQQTFGGFRGVPDQRVTRRGSAHPFACRVTANGVRMPATVNGRPVEWLFDTAFSHTSLTESEARRLGIAVHGGAGSAGDFTGASTSIRTAVIARLQIGSAELSDVPALIFADTQEPWRGEAAGAQGTLALPVVLALGGVGWNATGQCRVGDVHAARAQSSEVAFDGATPVVRARIGTRASTFVLDTGNQSGSQLWEPFARDFPEFAATGKKSIRTLQQIGGTTEQEIAAIPELALRFGGGERVLRPANLFGRTVGDGFNHGLLGMDLISQATAVTLDFRSMRISVR
jgi:aspartyl protease